MKNILLTTAMAFAMTTPAFAAGTHSGGHGHDEAEVGHGHAEMAAGTPGNAEGVTRTIDVTMRETDEGAMIFEPASFEFERGETLSLIHI